MKRIVCLISGRGSNLEAILRTAEAERWATEVPARVVAVMSNRAEAAGLAIASVHGVPTTVIEHQRFGAQVVWRCHHDRNRPVLQACRPGPGR